MKTTRNQQHINISIDHFSNLGPGYPVHVGEGRIEWHTEYRRNWMGVLCVPLKYSTAVIEALYQLCAANRWVIDFMDVSTSDPREIWVDGKGAVEWVQAIRKLPPHPQAEQFRQNYLNHITKS